MIDFFCQCKSNHLIYKVTYKHEQLRSGILCSVVLFTQAVSGASVGRASDPRTRGWRFDSDVSDRVVGSDPI